MDIPEVMTVEEFGALVRLPRSTAYGVVRRGEVAVINVGSRLQPRWRITRAAYERYLVARRVNRRTRAA